MEMINITSKGLTKNESDVLLLSVLSVLHFKDWHQISTFYLKFYFSLPPKFYHAVTTAVLPLTGYSQ